MRITLALTGASGIPIGMRLAEELSQRADLSIVVSNPAKKVMEEELDDRDAAIEKLERLSTDFYSEDDIDSSIASGSFDTEGMVIAPCSMKTLSSLAFGRASNLIERAGDVCLKEKRKLVLVPRETPLNQIHLENMLKLSKVGAEIVPPMMGFYFDPESVEDLTDYVVGKVLESFEIDQDLYDEWRGVKNG